MSKRQEKEAPSFIPIERPFKTAIDVRIFAIDKMATLRFDETVISLRFIFEQRRRLAELMLSAPYGREMEKVHFDLLDMLNKIIKETLILE